MLHVIPTLFDADGERVLGGGERYALELARHMAPRAPTRLISFGPAARTSMIGELPVRIIVGARHLLGNEYNPVSLKVVEEVLQADVVHCHQGGIFVSKLMAAVARMTGRSVVTTDHGGAMWDLSWYLPLERLYQAHLHVSAFSRRNSGHEGRRDATVVYGGVDVDKFSPGTPGPAAGRVLFVGRLLPHKGVDDLIEALPAGVGLDVCGRIADERFCARLVSLAAGKDVAFHHDWSDAQVVTAYQTALCIALTSRHVDAYGVATAVPELLGQTVLEGMACGRPAVVSDVTSLPEVVVDGQTGFVVTAGDQAALHDRIQWLAANPEEASAMGQAGRSRVLEKFSWPSVVSRCLAVYGSLRSP